MPPWFPGVPHRDLPPLTLATDVLSRPCSPSQTLPCTVKRKTMESQSGQAGCWLRMSPLRYRHCQRCAGCDTTRHRMNPALWRDRDFPTLALCSARLRPLV